MKAIRSEEKYNKYLKRLEKNNLEDYKGIIKSAMNNGIPYEIAIQNLQYSIDKAWLSRLYHNPFIMNAIHLNSEIYDNPKNELVVEKIIHQYIDQLQKYEIKLEGPNRVVWALNGEKDSAIEVTWIFCQFEIPNPGYGKNEKINAPLRVAIIESDSERKYEDPYPVIYQGGRAFGEGKLTYKEKGLLQMQSTNRSNRKESVYEDNVDKYASRTRAPSLDTFASDNQQSKLQKVAFSTGSENMSNYITWSTPEPGLFDTPNPFRPKKDKHITKIQITKGGAINWKGGLDKSKCTTENGRLVYAYLGNGEVHPEGFNMIQGIGMVKETNEMVIQLGRHNYGSHDMFYRNEIENNITKSDSNSHLNFNTAGGISKTRKSYSLLKRIGYSPMNDQYESKCNDKGRIYSGKFQNRVVDGVEMGWAFYIDLTSYQLGN